MTSPVTVLEPPRCPYCGETALIEHDPVSAHYVCLVCARTWTEPEA